MRFVSRLPSLPVAVPGAAVVSIAIAFGVSLGACSSAREANYQNPAWAGAQPPVPAPQQQAAYEPAAGDPIKDAPIEPRRAPAMPDDPSEPFSPNYGGPRIRPPVKVSDYDVEVQDPQPNQPKVIRNLPAPSRGYFKKVTTTASAD